MSQSQKPNTSTSADPLKPKSFSQSKHEHWKPIISAWRDSGLSQSAFCRKNDLNLPRFAYWRAKIPGKADADLQSSSARLDASPFVPVKRAHTPGEPGLLVSLPNGIILSGINEHNVVLLKAVIQAL